MSGAVFVLVNVWHFSHPANCLDCNFPRGLPFTFYQEGGYAGDSGFVSPGLVRNLAAILTLGMLIAIARKPCLEKSRPDLAVYATKYLASGWCATIADVDCSGSI
jgi:hypothetical protein